MTKLEGDVIRCAKAWAKVVYPDREHMTDPEYKTDRALLRAVLALIKPKAKK